MVWAGNTGTPTGGDHCMSLLSSSGISVYSQAYSSDSLDRITSGPAGTYTYGDPNHLHGVTGVSDMPNQYASYDAMGNLTCRNTDTTSGHTCASSTPTGAVMTYDNQGRLASWTAPSGTSASETYLYDNEGNLVLTTNSTSGVSTDTFTFDDYTETTISGTLGKPVTTSYYSVNGQRLAEKIFNSQVQSTFFDYLVNDLLSNVVMALGSSGTVSAVELYEPYGSLNYSWGNMPTDHNYTGQRLDSQSGLLYYNFRWYDPLVGQFVRTDTKQNDATGNDPYAYVNDNPESKTDPTGHWGWGDIIAATAIAIVVAVVVVVAAPVVIAAAAAAIDVGVTAVTAGAAAAAAGEGVTGIAGAAVAMGYAASVLGPDLGAAGDDAAAAMDNPCGDELSFVAATPVATAHGEQAISTLKVGEKVWAYNSQTKKMEQKPVQKVWLNHDTDLVDLTLTTTVKNTQGKVTHTSEVIHTNEKHPFLTKEKGFIPVSQLKPGMHVLEANGSYGVVAKLVIVPGGQWMYNLTVAQDHTYTVGMAHWIVHNDDSGCLPMSDEEAQYAKQKLQQANQMRNSLGSSRTRPGAYTLVEDENGNPVTGAPSGNAIEDPDYGHVQCGEGHCLINMRDDGSIVPGRTYNFYTYQ